MKIVNIGIKSDKTMWVVRGLKVPTKQDLLDLKINGDVVYHRTSKFKSNHIATWIQEK